MQKETEAQSLGPLRSKPVVCRGPLRSGVGADQGQGEPWPRDLRDVGSIFLAPAELEPVTDFLNWNRFPPRPPLAVVFGQDEMIDVDLVPVFGQQLAVSGEICRACFVVPLRGLWLLRISRSQVSGSFLGRGGQAAINAAQTCAPVGNRASAM